LVDTGEVLIAGGQNYGLLNNVEIYYPITDTWKIAASLPISRTQHAAELTADGQVMVVGGWGINGPLSSVELYDPLTNGWNEASPLNIARCVHTLTLLPNGDLLTTGGTGPAPLKSAELWSTTPNPTETPPGPTETPTPAPPGYTVYLPVAIKP
jgi:N-acetylneuraminic acid mutarotase